MEKCRKPSFDFFMTSDGFTKKAYSVGIRLFVCMLVLSSFNSKFFHYFHAHAGGRIAAVMEEVLHSNHTGKVGK